jgi:hypothetical protein
VPNGGAGNGLLATANGLIRVTDYQGTLDLKCGHGTIVVQRGGG